MERKNLLIVDDHEDILFLLEQSILQTWPNHSVITAKNGVDALSCLERVPIDLMLIDYRMPGMNGLELAERVRQLAPAIRIILMSSVKPPELKSDKPLFDAFLDKPFGIAAIQPFVA